METYNLLILLFAFIFLAIWNALVINWGLSNNPTDRMNYSDAWHKVGWLIRAALATYVASAYGLFFAWLAVVALWQLYDIIINLGRKMKPFYVDEKTRFSKLTIATWVAKAAWIAAGSLFLIV